MGSLIRNMRSDLTSETTWRLPKQLTPVLFVYRTIAPLALLLKVALGQNVGNLKENEATTMLGIPDQTTSKFHANKTLSRTKLGTLVSCIAVQGWAVTREQPLVECLFYVPLVGWLILKDKANPPQN